MKKRIFSAVWALALVFGSAAALPEGSLLSEFNITAGAATSVDQFEFTQLSDGTYEVTKFIGENTEIIVPATYKNKDVTSIGDNAFKDCKNITTVTLTNNITNIGEYAFEYCFKLSSINIPKNVKNIGRNAFSSCYRLKRITIPEGITAIGIYAFSDCQSLESVTLPESLTAIRLYAFFGCINLKEITVPKAVTFIGENALGYHYSTYTSDTVVKSRVQGFTIKGYRGTEAEEYAYQNKLNFIPLDMDDSIENSCKFRELDDGTYEITDYHDFDTEIMIPETHNGKKVTSIGEKAFEGNKRLTNVIITNNINNIGNYAFSGCKNLESINIPGSVTELGRYAFTGCSKLTKIKLPYSLTTIKGATFFDCPNLIKVSIPSSVSKIENYAFGYCYDEDHQRAKVAGFTIEGCKGTAAEKYAKDNGFTFIALDDDNDRTPGDVNDDGKVDLTDVITLKQSVAGWKVKINESNADVTGDKKADIKDVILLKQHLAGWKVTLK